MKIILNLMVLLFSTHLVASTSVENMAHSLMKLRAEVVSLDSQIEDEKDEFKASMKSLIMEKNELDTSIAREELSQKRLTKDLAKIKKQITDQSKNSEGLKPIVLHAITKIEERIKSAIPFKVNDRLSDIKRISEQLEGALITPQKALVLVWNSYSDMIRMSKENAVFKQTILIDGKEVLAQVARVGSVMMYFKTPDDRVGYVTNDGGSYTYLESVEKEQKEQILTLFDAFKKQIRSGYFTLPNALLEVK